MRDHQNYFLQYLDNENPELSLYPIPPILLLVNIMTLYSIYFGLILSPFSTTLIMNLLLLTHNHLGFLWARFAF
jgi:hypothetical protein